ncbi:MAG TPA: hypothetical protein VJ372_08425, partial [Pyrinomonadaceae bacterium]|nr:hypothetical protein [Pyrinomonadaceae bacterium]
MSAPVAYTYQPRLDPSSKRRCIDPMKGVHPLQCLSLIGRTKLKSRIISTTPQYYLDTLEVALVTEDL